LSELLGGHNLISMFLSIALFIESPRGSSFLRKCPRLSDSPRTIAIKPGPSTQTPTNRPTVPSRPEHGDASHSSSTPADRTLTGHGAKGQKDLQARASLQAAVSRGAEHCDNAERVCIYYVQASCAYWIARRRIFFTHRADC
jgi:hypothetical protein